MPDLVYFPQQMFYQSFLPYCLVGLAAFLEGPITILTTGAAVSLGKLQALPALFALIIGNLTADFGWYSLGRFSRLEWLERLCIKAGIDLDDIKELEKNIHQHAPHLLFLSKLTVGLPIPTLITIGLHRVEISIWIGWLVLGELIKTSILAAIGFLFASGVQKVFNSVETVMFIITITILLISISIFYSRHHKGSMIRRQFNDSKNAQMNETIEIKQTTLPQNDRGIVVIPACNEESHVAAVVQSALNNLPVLIVDDGSIDNTAQQSESAGAFVLKNPKNLGKGASLQSGFRYALTHGYNFAVTLDADGQHNPHEIPKFLQAYADSHSDLIIGSRDFSLMPPIRRLSNTLGTKIFSWAVGKPIIDNQSGYRLISRRLMEILEGSDEQGFEFEVEMIVRCLLHSCKIQWVPIQTIYGGERSHIQPIRHGLRFIRACLKANRVLKNSS